MHDVRYNNRKIHNSTATKMLFLPQTIHIKSVQGQENQGKICGYGSIFDQIDSQNDRVVRGAFQKTLAKIKTRGVFPKMLWQHDQTQPIGIWTKMEEDSRGLYVEGNLLLDLQQGQEAYHLVKSGGIDGLSIGYQVCKALKGKDSGVRLLTELELFEVSLVTFAANPQAKITNLS